MTRIALVVSDVDGTLLTKDKTLTDGAMRAARRLHEAGIGFTITSSRPTIGMRFLIEPLAITLPVGAFNGSSIVDPKLNPIEQHLIPASAGGRCLDVLNEFGVDIWLFTNELWLTRRPTANMSRMNSAPSAPIRPSLRILRPICRPPARSSAPAPMRRCCNAAKPRCRGPWARRPLRCDRKAIISTSPHPAATRAPSCRRWLGALAFRPTWSPPSATWQNDLAMFRNSGVSIAMGNATDDVKKQATHVTTSNEDEGFAGAIDMILKGNEAADRRLRGSLHDVVPARTPGSIRRVLSLRRVWQLPF